MLRQRIDDNLISLYEARTAFLTVQRYQATTRCLQLSNSFVFIFSIFCNALHLERKGAFCLFRTCLLPKEVFKVQRKQRRCRVKAE